MYLKSIIVLLCLAPLFCFTALCGATERADERLDFSIPFVEVPPIIATFQGCTVRDSTHVNVTLSDGSCWLIKCNEAEIQQGWKVGDDIRIKKVPDSKYFVLKSVYSSVPYLGVLDQNCDGSSVYYIDQIDANGYAVKMNDGSEWTIGWLDSFLTQHWCPGDRLAINKSHFSRDEDYLVINLHNSTSCWASLISWRE
jgi:hypothetical protein